MDGPNEPSELTCDDYVALAEFRHQLREFLSFSEAQARAVGLEPQQHQLLLAIKGLPGGAAATVGSIAERIKLRHNSTVELVNRLEGHGLIRRRRGEQDGREVFVELTRKGENVLHKLSHAHRNELQETGPRLIRALRLLIRDTKRRQACA